MSAMSSHETHLEQKESDYLRIYADRTQLIDGLLAYDGSTAFYASEVPSGDAQAAISTESGSYSVTFEWSAI